MDHRVPIVANKLKEILADKKAEEMAVEILKALDDDGGTTEGSITPSTPPGGEGIGVPPKTTLDEKKVETIEPLQAEGSKTRRRWPPINEEMVRAVIEFILKEASAQSKLKSKS